MKTFIGFCSRCFLLVLILDKTFLKLTEGRSNSTYIRCYQCTSNDEWSAAGNSTVDCLQGNPPTTQDCQMDVVYLARCMVLTIKDQSDTGSSSTSGISEISKDCFKHAFHCLLLFADFEPVDGKCLKRMVTLDMYRAFIQCRNIGPPTEKPVLEGRSYFTHVKKSRQQQQLLTEQEKEDDATIEITICTCKNRDLCNTFGKEDVNHADWAPVQDEVNVGIALRLHAFFLVYLLTVTMNL